MLVVPLLNTKGVHMRRIKVGGQKSAGTTFIELDDVKVPVENIIGKENSGMLYVMQNFNHERVSWTCESGNLYLRRHASSQSRFP